MVVFRPIKYGLFVKRSLDGENVTACDIHSHDKQAVGHWLALIPLANTYGAE